MKACELVFRVGLVAMPGGLVHMTIKAANAPKHKRRTLCGASMEGGQTLAIPGVDNADRNPFLSDRGCEDCGQALSI